MTVIGVDRTPLLLGKVQFRLVHSDQREMVMEELLLREVVVDPKENTTILKKILLEDEHEADTVDPSKMKCFMPKLLTAVEWSKDCLQSSLEKIAEMRQTRSSR